MGFKQRLGGFLCRLGFHHKRFFFWGWSTDWSMRFAYNFDAYGRLVCFAPPNDGRFHGLGFQGCGRCLVSLDGTRIAKTFGPFER